MIAIILKVYGLRLLLFLPMIVVTVSVLILSMMAADATILIATMVGTTASIIIGLLLRNLN